MGHGEAICNSKCPAGFLSGFLCTREKGHAGPHEAHLTTGEAVARWHDNEPVPVKQPTTTNELEFTINDKDEDKTVKVSLKIDDTSRGGKILILMIDGVPVVFLHDTGDISLSARL